MAISKSDVEKTVGAPATEDTTVDKLGQLIEKSLDDVAGGFDDFHLISSHMEGVP